MTPPSVLAEMLKRDIDVIGAVDHNASGNARAFLAAASHLAGKAVHILPGLEIESLEGVHVLCLCDDAEAAEAMQDFVWAHLPESGHRPEVFGEQWLVDTDGKHIRQEMRPLLRSAKIKLEEICVESKRRGLLTIPAHVTRRGYGLFGVLGFMPEGLDVDALELGPPMLLSAPAKADLERHPHIRSSDAHWLEDIGTACTDLWVEELTVAEIKLAFQERSGRRASVVGSEP